MTTVEFIETLQQQGFTLIPLPGEKLAVKPAERLTDPLREQIRQRKAEVLALLTEQQPSRAFLSRPLGQEDNPDPWDAWHPLMLWLLEHHPRHYHTVREAEEAIRSLERSGISDGLAYESACKKLLHRFEEARGLKLAAGFAVWLQ